MYTVWGSSSVNSDGSQDTRGKKPHEKLCGQEFYVAISVQIPLKATPEPGDLDCLRAGGELDTGKILYQVYILPIQKLTYF